jgi:hypothetical protein
MAKTLRRIGALKRAPHKPTRGHSKRSRQELRAQARTKEDARA